MAAMLLAAIVACAQPTESLSLERRRALSRVLAAEIERTSPPTEDRIVAQYVQMLAGRIASRSSAAFSGNIKTVDDTSPRAFVLPDGQLYISTRLVAITRTEAELAGVLAHLIAHVAHGDPGLTQNPGSIPLALGCVRLQGLGTLFANASHEQATDLLALDYLVNAGFDPHGLIEFFGRSARPRVDLSSAESRAAQLSSDSRDYVLTSSEYESVRRRAQPRDQTSRVPPSLYRPGQK